MLFLRSLLCQLFFYLNFFAFGLMLPAVLFGTRGFVWLWASWWARSTIFWWRITTGSSVEFRGLENIPKGGCIIASKHQSTWETVGLVSAIFELVYIMKQELMYIPVFGWFCWKAGMIPVRRKDKSRALGPMISASKKAVKAGRKIVIFMEGTRVAAGATQPYKVGVAKLYSKLDCPILPVALNTGLFWPRNSYWRYSGRVIIEFLPPIMPGEKPKNLLKTLEERVEVATNALILETARSDNPPPTIDKALDALKARGIDTGSDI